VLAQNEDSEFSDKIEIEAADIIGDFTITCKN
jgi:hypothetical protein